jgi:hypothetical protein
LAVATACAFGLASAAHAKTITATFTGTIYITFGDVQGFGLPSNQLIGQAVKAVYTVDDAKGFSAFDAPFSSQIFGGPAFGTASPVAAAITVNGVTVEIDGSFSSQAHQFAPPSGQSSVSYISQDRTLLTSGFYDVFSTDGAFSSTDGFVKSYDYHVAPGVVPLPDISVGLFGENLFDQSNNLVSFAQFAWSPTSLTITAQGVPEPSTWALMLAGFGMAGAALRRRTQATG